MTKASDNAFPSLLITEGTEPSAPAAGKQRLYIDSTTHHLMRTNSSGTETDIESGGTGIPATILDAKGDLIAASAADTAAKVTVGSNGTILLADSAQSAGLLWYVPVASVVNRTNIGSNITTSSTTFADMDGTNLTITMTTRAVRVLLYMIGVCSNDTSGAVTSFNFKIDGSVVTGSTSDRGVAATRASAAGASFGIHATWVSDVLSAGSHTFRPMWKVSSGTATGLQTASTDYLRFAVTETLFTS